MSTVSGCVLPNTRRAIRAASSSVVTASRRSSSVAPAGRPSRQSECEDYARHRAHPYLRKIETAGGWKAYEKAHRTKLLATFVPKFTHLVPKELVPLIVEFSFHVGFY